MKKSKNPDDELDSLKISDDQTMISPIESLDPLDVKQTPSLLMISGSQIGRSFPIGNRTEFMIGRASHCDLPIEDDLVSRHHCKILLGPKGAEIVDLASTNGTLINGIKVERSELREGDQVQVGAITIFRYHLQEDIEAKFLGQLYEAATRDFLTNAYNKKFFVERLQDEFAFTQRHQGNLSVLVIDIDHFKKVNDTYGHLAGDLAIKKVAHHLITHTRKDDIVARFGGEEFVVLMRDLSLENAKNLGETLRKGISEIVIKGDQYEFQLTVSIGIASISQNNFVQIKSFSHLIEEADKRLYEAKSSGRNKVCA